MKATELVQHCRGLKKGTVSPEEASELAGLLRLEPMTEVLRDLIQEIADYDGDFLVHDGDLHIEGPLEVHALPCVVLIVRGSLTVEGCYSDDDDPQTITFIEDDLRARSVVTAGFLEVGGDAIIEGAFLGDYNDCNARIGGTLRCGLFYPEEHFFEVGAFEAKVAIGNVKHRVAGATVEGVLEMDDLRLLEHFDAELLSVNGEGEDLTVDGFEQYREVRKRVKAGLPLKT